MTGSNHENILFHIAGAVVIMKTQLSVSIWGQQLIFIAPKLIIHPKV